jgi:hypothetical protein
MQIPRVAHDLLNGNDANKYIDPERALIVIVGNASQIREPLGTLGYPIHDLDVDGNLLPVA